MIFDRLGPYHVARLKCVADTVTLAVIEIAGRSAEYEWDFIDTFGAFHKVTCFPHLTSKQVSLRTLKKELFSELSKLKPDVVAIPGWSHRASLIALSYCLANSVPVVIMSDSNAIDAKRYWPKELVKKRILSLVGSAIAGGERSAKYMATLGVPTSHIFVGYDVVDNVHFAQKAREVGQNSIEVRRKLGLPPRYFLASCRFVAKKNLTQLLRAYALYKARQGSGSWKLVVLGNGDLWKTLHEQRHKLGLDDHVIFPGFIQYSQLPIYYGLATTFVHASIVEQWGLVVNEALASGLPVLVSRRCGCVAELVHEGRNGFTFDPFDAHELADLMVKMTDRTDLQSMGAASEEIIRDWSPEKFATNLLQATTAAIVNGPKRNGVIDRLLISALTQ